MSIWDSMKKFLPAALVAFPFLLSAQTIIINRVELTGNKVIVLYDLNSPNQNQEFLLNLYGSRDSFAAPLSRVTGDVGGEIKPGTNKKIEWNITEEYGSYKGKLALEVRGRVYTPFVRTESFQLENKYKRGKVYNISWVPGNTTPVHLELFKGEERMQGSMNHPNTGGFTFSIPQNAKTGSDYHLKVSSSQNAEESFFTPYFKITPKVSPIVKFGLPLLVVGGVAAILSSGEGGGEPDPGEIQEPAVP